MMLYRERFYDVVFGRFVNRDPIEYDAEDVNLYRYVWNNPLFYIDSLGYAGTEVPQGLENLTKYIENLIDGWLSANPPKTPEEINAELKKIQNSLSSDQQKLWNTAEKHAGWRNRKKRGNKWENKIKAALEKRGKIAKKVAKRIPLVGICVGIYCWAEDVEAKGTVYGTINTGIDIIPVVGVGKGIIEIL
jgi:hypothetical protein